MQDEPAAFPPMPASSFPTHFVKNHHSPGKRGPPRGPGVPNRAPIYRKSQQNFDFILTLKSIILLCFKLVLAPGSAWNGSGMSFSSILVPPVCSGTPGGPHILDICKFWCRNISMFFFIFGLLVGVFGILVASMRSGVKIYVEWCSRKVEGTILDPYREKYIFGSGKLDMSARYI